MIPARLLLRCTARTGGTALFVVALMSLGHPGLASASAPNAVAIPNGVPTICEVDLPVRIDLDINGALPAAGSRTELIGTFVTQDAMASVTVRLEAYGNVGIAGGDRIELGAVGAGETRTFTFSADYAGDGDGTVHAFIDADPGDGSPILTRRGSLFSAIEAGQTMIGKASALDLKFQVIDASTASGKFSTTQAAAARTAMTRIQAERVTDQVPAPPLTPILDQLNDLVAEFDLRSEFGNPPAISPAGGLTVSGQITWDDENGNPHPAYGIVVSVFEDNLLDIFLGTQVTFTDGLYSIAIPNVDLDNGIPDIYVSVSGTNGWIDLQPNGGGSYSATGPTATDQAAMNIVYNLNINNGGPAGGAFSVFQASTWIAGHTANRRGGVALPQIVTFWPNGGTGSFYDGNLNIEQADRWDWDTIHHEYGHYIADVLNTENNPGGPHGIGDCISVTGGHDKDEGLRLAWGEGWPTYNGTSAQTDLGLAALSIPRVGDTQYDDQEDDGVNYDLEPQSNGGKGEDNELAVQRMLWDAYDSASDGRDALSLTSQFIWDTLDNADPTTLSAAWNALYAASSPFTDLALSEISCDHNVGPSLQAPVEGAIIGSVGQAQFSWDKDVGCSATFAGNQFDLVFLDQVTGSPLLTKAGLAGTSYGLTQGELDLLRNNSHYAYWAVRGYNTSAPASGPYMGESFLITLNTPPVADAGADVTVECTSPTVTAVLLNGSGSMDADGDALTYSWSATGVSFDNAASPTPTGQFPHGTTVVTLTVFDGFQEDTDTVEIRVDDTTPPVVSCPQAVTIECNDHCSGGGVPKDDAQLSKFYAGVSATDICDSSPDITDDSPACFPVGTTDVVFTAEDDHGNAASCTTSVTVEDTTPPEITMTLNRDSLWPPNHKLADVMASVEVTDICDPNPTFVLTSITSDEPDNGLGDGDTADDIQEATVGEPDTAFRLRSERAGNLDGRKYTVIYTASDISGNTASDTACVFVPHDRRGGAHAAAGFVPSGLAIDPTSMEYQLVLLGTVAMPAESVAGASTGVGNGLGAFRPRRFEYRDVNGDARTDLLICFDTKATMDLRRISTKKDPIGFHYWGSDGNGYLVDDIFKLGAPISIVSLVDAGDHDGQDVVDGGGIETDQPISGLPGNIVTGFDTQGALVLTEAGPVVVELFDVTGRKVRTLVTRDLSAGSHDLGWDGRDDAGHAMSSGLYFYRAQTSTGTFTRKVLIRQ